MNGNVKDCKPLCKNQKISIGILLSMGVVENPEDLNVCAEDGNILKITIKGPTVMTCVKKLTQKWLAGQGRAEIRVYRPQVLEFLSF